MMKLGNLTLLVPFLFLKGNGVLGMDNLRKMEISPEHAAKIRDLQGEPGEACFDVYPSTFILPATVGGTNYCYKIEAKTGGRFYVDTEDEGCANYNAGNAYGGSSISRRGDFSGNGFVYYPPKKNWAAVIDITEDASLSEPVLEISVDDGKKKGPRFIDAKLTVPSCSTRTPCTSFPNSVYFLPAKFQGANYCYRVELTETGSISVDTEDNGCETYKQTWTYGGSVVGNVTFSNDSRFGFSGDNWYGGISVLEDTSLSEPMLEIRPYTKPKSFDGTLVLPSCGGR